jgi:hypothetical protein
VAENYEPIPPEDDSPRCDMPDDGLTGVTQCLDRPGAKISLKHLKRIALFHYATKSWQDFETKMVRGDWNSGEQAKKKDPYFYFTVEQCVASLVFPLPNYMFFA